MSDYDTDIYAWSQRQGGLLRRLAAGERVNDADLDWPNIAEEIETVGRSERAAVASHIAIIIEHLIKLQASPASEPRAGWIMTIDRSRGEIERLLGEQPFLAGERLSLADVLFAPQLDFLAATPEGASLLAGTRLNAWLGRMKARPSLIATPRPLPLQAAA